MVLDEPNSNLDAEGENALSNAIANVKARGGIVIVIAHRPSALANVDLVAVTSCRENAALWYEGRDFRADCCVRIFGRSHQTISRELSKTPVRHRQQTTCDGDWYCNYEISPELPLAKHIAIVVLLAFGLVVGVFGWAMTTELSSAVIASGHVVVEGNTKKIQHLVGGIVSEIDVKEGDRVDANQVLVRLNGTVVQANLSISENTLAQLCAPR